MTFGSLFAGIGGFDLGLERAGMTCKWQVEIDPFCRRVLAKHWPDVPRLEDVRSVSWRDVEPVDAICGGFPCIDISAAGKKGGIGGPHSGLWREFRRLIGEIQPKYALVENVSALLDRGMGDVLGDLAEVGFDAEWACLPAATFGAPHQRNRVFVVAWRDWEPVYDLSRFDRCECCDDWWCPRCDEHAGYCCCLTEGRTDTPVVSRSWGDVTYPNGQRAQISTARIFTAESMPQRSSWWETEPRVERVVHGVSSRLDRINALGNAVVPQIAEFIGRRLMEASGRV